METLSQLQHWILARFDSESTYVKLLGNLHGKLIRVHYIKQAASEMFLEGDRCHVFHWENNFDACRVPLSDVGRCPIWATRWQDVETVAFKKVDSANSEIKAIRIPGTAQVYFSRYRALEVKCPFHDALNVSQMSHTASL